MPSGKCKRTGAGKRTSKITKRAVRKAFNLRHIDQVRALTYPCQREQPPTGTPAPSLQVWNDVRQDGVHGTKFGPLGTIDRVELDQDLPAHGKHYCIACARYFISEVALADHGKTKAHKKRVKELTGAKPHSQADAEWAAGMGRPDNGMPYCSMLS